MRNWQQIRNGDSFIIVNLNRVNYIKYEQNKLSFHFGDNHNISISDEEIVLKDIVR